MVDDDAPVCFAGAAIQRWREENNTLEAGALPYVHRLTEDEITRMRG